MRSKSFLLVPILALALVLSACGGTSKDQENQENQVTHSITVNGNGTVYATPDIAYIYIGVHTENADIAQAVEKNNTQAQAVVDALKSFGVNAKDIQTSNFSVWASQQPDPTTGQSNTTYMVDNTVYVTVRDLTKLGELLDTAIQAGANNINSVQFDVADKTEALKQARQKAMDSAKSLAEELTGIAGVSLGEIQTISYTDYQAGYYYGGMGGGGGGGAALSAPINPGQLPLSVSVNVNYLIK